ncbi:peptidase S24 [Sphingomonas sp. ZT3P38]|uniref:peptidase S24 n=1 Tax=Parasphingomonas zepuensis TaxID=3096161 RepID=UPI002FCC9FEF
MTDPIITADMIRATLERQARQHGETFAGLSRMLRRGDRYLQRFVREGTPRSLEPEEARTLARYFRIDPMLLGAPRRQR